MDQKMRLQQGTEVTVIFMGQQLRKRVWADLETLILVCSDEEYQQKKHNHNQHYIST